MAEIQPNLIYFLVCRKRLWRAPMPVWLWWWNPANTAWVTSRLWRPCVRARLNWCSSPATPLLWGEKVDFILVDFDCNEKYYREVDFHYVQVCLFVVLLVEPYGVLLKQSWLRNMISINTCVDGNYGVVFCVTMCSGINVIPKDRTSYRIAARYVPLSSVQHSTAPVGSSTKRILAVRNSALESNDY